MFDTMLKPSTRPPIDAAIPQSVSVEVRPWFRFSATIRVKLAHAHEAIIMVSNTMDAC